MSGSPIQRLQNPASASTGDPESLAPGTGQPMVPEQTVDSPSTPHEIVSHSVAGSGSQLPYRDAIQRCFGRQDVSSGTAHQGPAATEDRDRSRSPIEGAVAVGLPVQREATANARSVDPRQAMSIAREGVTGASDPLPHVDAIQRSFGRHDITSAKAQVGGPATGASREIGARAYAQGDRVGFAEAPDLRTAAHEAAHIVHQRAGHAPAGGLDTPGDGLEQHADQVADAVVAGRPADHLLDQVAGAPASAVQRDAVQRWGDGSSVPWHAFLADLGLTVWLRDMWDRLRVIQRGPFGKYLDHLPLYVSALHEELLVDQIKPKLGELIAPEPLGPLIDRARALDYQQPDPTKPPVKTDKGSNRAHDQTVVIEIGNALARHYDHAVARVFPRVTALMVARNPPTALGQPPRSWVELLEADVAVRHPMDVIVRKALLRDKFGIQRAGVAAMAAHEVSGQVGDARAPDAPAVLTFAPEGKLWHWVKAEPPNATNEQVAATLFGKPEQAYRLIAMPPLWGFRARDAASAFTKPMFEKLGALVDAARKHPDPARRPTPDIADAVDMQAVDPEIDPAAELVKAKGDGFGMEREKQSTPGKPVPNRTADKHDEANVFQVEQGMLKNLADLDKLVPLFRLDTGPIRDARTRFQNRANEAASTCLPDAESAYRFADTQRGLLARIAVGIGDAVSRLAQQGGAVASDAVREPLTDMARAYLDALAAIEVPELAVPRLANADRLAHEIDIALQEAALHERLGELEGEFHESHARRDPLVKPGQHADQLDNLAMQLADARLGMRESPAATEAKVHALKPQVDSLGFQIGLGEKLARLNLLWEAIDHEEGLWERIPEREIGKRLKAQNRALYERFKAEVHDPFMAAEQANDSAGKQAAQRAYNAILTGPEMKEHGETVRKFLAQVAKHKKWTKFVVSLAITFVAFGLGQWEFGAVMAAEGTLFEAAVAGGLVTTTTSVVLNKLVFDQNPTAVSVLTSFAFNVGTFFVIGKLALAARAAAAEAALAEGAQDAAVAADVAVKTSTAGKVAGGAGKHALGLAKEAVVAEAMGFGQAQVEKAIEKHELLTAEESEDIFIQSLVGVVGMRVFHAMAPSDLFQYKTPEQKLASDLAWLRTEQAALQERAREVGDVARNAPRATPDRAAILEVLARWKQYLEREQKARERLLDYAEKHPGKFKPEDIARLKSAGTDPTLLRQMRGAQAMLAIETDGINRFSCAAGTLDLVIEQHRAVGNAIERVQTDPHTGQRTITVKPADGSPAFEITEQVPPKGKRTQAKVAVGSARHFEAWLDARELHHPHGQTELRELYQRDPEAAINYASEKYGYLPESVADKGLLVAPDAPGQAGAPPREPVVSAGDHQLAVKLGHGAVAVGNGRFLAAPTELADMHASWAKRADARPSKIVYDPDTNTSHFEIEVDGKQARVEAQLAAKVQSFHGMAGVENRVVGGRISEALGVEILRSVVLGEHEMLRATGIGGDLVKPGDAVEFGLGRLHDGKCVIVVGGGHEVDWSAMPGIEPAGHTHPSTRGNDLRPDIHGRRAMSVEEMLDPSKPRYLNRQLVLPSAPDFITMAQLAIKGHRVFTPFVVENGVVRKPGPGEHLPLLEFTIGETQQVGTLSTGERVFESTLEGTAGSETPITRRKVWVIEGKTETNALGRQHQGDSFVEFAEPPGLQRAAATPTVAPKGSSRTRTALSPEMQKLAHLHGDDAVHWALASLPESDVAAVLAVRTPLRELLMKVPAVDARDLLAIVPEPELARALTKGGSVTAEQLARLRLQLGDATAKDMILSAVSAKQPQGPLERLARIADGVEPASARLPGASLGSESLVLDSNARSALEDCQRAHDKKGNRLATFGDVDGNYKDAINAMRRVKHLGPLPDTQPLPLTLEQLLWPGADLRMAQVAGAEAIAGEAKTGAKSLTLPHLKGIQPERGHKDYAAVVQELAKQAIGGPSGGPDRAIVADTLFTPSPSGSLPTLVTVDELVYLRLARKFADPPITWPKPPKGVADPPMAVKLRSAPEASGGVFTISILGHKMNIRYM